MPCDTVLFHDGAGFELTARQALGNHGTFPVPVPVCLGKKEMRELLGA